MKTFSPVGSANHHAAPPIWPVVLLLVMVSAYRVLLAWWTAQGGGGAELPGWMLNFTPVAATALGSGRFLPGRWLAWGLPVGMMLITDAIVDRFYGARFLSPVELAPVCCIAALAVAGSWLRRRAPGAGALMAMTLAGSTGFYMVTNTLSWYGAPGYPQTLAGYLQALTVGLPGYPPTWIFFRNSLVSDLVVSGLLLVGGQRRFAPGERRTYSPASDSI